MKDKLSTNAPFTLATPRTAIFLTLGNLTTAELVCMVITVTVSQHKGQEW